MTSSEEGALALYSDLVRRWAPRLNLVSEADLKRFEERHVADSLRPLPLIETLPPGPCVDVGSGAGLPGIPLAILAPRREWRLLEPRRNRVAFLETVVRELDLGVEVVARTAQEAARDPRFNGAHSLATARALAAPDTAFPWMLPLVRNGGAALVFSGRGSAVPDGAEAWGPGLAIVRKEDSKGEVGGEGGNREP